MFLHNCPDLPDSVGDLENECERLATELNAQHDAEFSIYPDTGRIRVVIEELLLPESETGRSLRRELALSVRGWADGLEGGGA